jgi:hypothetical protein
MGYEALLEDEDNIFGGSPKSKYRDIAVTASDDVVFDELDRIFEKYAAMEHMLQELKGDSYEQEIKTLCLEENRMIDNMKKSLYIAFSGDIVCRLDS